MPPPPHQLPPIKPSHVNVPDLFLTALSVFCLFSTSSKIKLNFPFYPRRFIKIPTMSHPRTFATPQSLSDWLKPRLRAESFASWGVKPGTKNVHNLWLELAQGESILADASPPIRTVHVVTVRIINGHNRILIESLQELSDGSVRARGRPLSEKMKPGEDPMAVARRAVMEELGSVLPDGSGLGDDGAVVRIVEGSYRKTVEERSSASYPGLPACYELHSVEATVEGLPEEDFVTEEEHEYEDSGERRVASEAVSVKKHFWKWVSADSVNSELNS